MKEIKFKTLEYDRRGENTNELLQLGAKGLTHARKESPYPERITIVTDTDISELDLQTSINLSEELLDEFCYAEPEFGLTLLDALNELRQDFEVPEVGIKFVYEN